MIPALIDHWARSAAPGARRYRIHADGRTVLYASTFDGLGQMYAVYPDATAACRAMESDDISWRLDLRQARAEKVPV